MVTARDNARLRGVRIRRFRVVDDLEAGPFRRFNFVVGGAATGKTAFLQAVRLIKAHRPGARLL